MAISSSFRRDIEQAIREREEALGRGTAEGFNDYMRMVGEIAGFKFALGLLDERMKHTEEESDE